LAVVYDTIDFCHFQKYVSDFQKYSFTDFKAVYNRSFLNDFLVQIKESSVIVSNSLASMIFFQTNHH